jgi:hypothetical protein
MTVREETLNAAYAAQDIHSNQYARINRRRCRHDGRARAGASPLVKALVGGVLLATFGFPAPELQAQDPPFRSYGGSSISFDARVHAQYEAPSAEGAVSSFFMRRAWVTLDGRYNDFVSGRLQLDALGTSVLDAWLTLNFSEAFVLNMGQFKRGLSYFWLVPNSDLPLIERDARISGVDECPGVGGVCSFGNLAFKLGLHGYEPGLNMTGRLGSRASYRVTLTNGEGINTRDANNWKSTSAQLSLDLTDNSRFAFYAAFDETHLDYGSVWTPAYGLEFEAGTWRDGGHVLLGAIRGRNWKVDPDAQFTALQALGLWYVRLPETARFEAIEPLLRLSWATTPDADGEDFSGFTITPGFMLYATGKNGISTNLDIYRSSLERTEWSLKVQAFTFL